jgi:hypothetical protein
MISYNQWKSEQINESSDSIEGLIDAAVGQIERAVNDYIDRISPANQLKDKFGGAVNKLKQHGQAIKDTASQYGQSAREKVGKFGSRIKQGVNDYLDKNVGMASTAGEPARGISRREMLGRNYPALNTLIHGTGKVPKGSSAWRHLGDRLSGFFGKKEWHDFVTGELQEALAECGVSRLLLIENNDQFSQLRQLIHSVLSELAEKIRIVMEPAIPTPTSPKDEVLPMPKAKATTKTPNLAQAARSTPEEEFKNEPVPSVPSEAAPDHNVFDMIKSKHSGPLPKNGRTQSAKSLLGNLKRPWDRQNIKEVFRKAFADAGKKTHHSTIGRFAKQAEETGRIPPEMLQQLGLGEQPKKEAPKKVQPKKKAKKKKK